MDMYHFSDNVSESIVRGIMKGYKSYLQERKSKKEELRISSAYAWVKGNHIDHFVAEECEPLGITYRPSRAGNAWGYLQFQSVQERIIFLIKNSSTVGGKIRTSKQREENYLEKLTNINTELDFTKFAARSEQLSLSLFDHMNVNTDAVREEVENLSKEFERFYIVTYTIDEHKMISDIKLCLPDPHSHDLYLVDSWKRFLDKIDIEIKDEDMEGVKEDFEPEHQISLGDYGLIVGTDTEHKTE